MRAPKDGGSETETWCFCDPLSLNSGEKVRIGIFPLETSSLSQSRFPGICRSEKFSESSGVGYGTEWREEARIVVVSFLLDLDA